ncbi:helix-turn-helix domain-containing protein [Sphingomonas sp. LaA6.9]|uniref:helix-turn-helix domain-containing protein n=1 Tax=Sphingomonas sp. LaA6.9 TaxID=2919914 RepID=UPI001F4F5C1C|nr:helix-turn-helix domain-containing protein [Sphingomonas sp. LaA6.9]MCJ8158877.1 helix-turn-helix domain-containing protein [Sphingomonas sp. LaA6.9]
MASQWIHNAHDARRSPYFTNDEAAHYLGISSRSLRRLRATGQAPQHRWHGMMIRYHIDDLENWSRPSRANPGG